MATSGTFDLIFSCETRAFKFDADMVLNLIDGLLLQVLSSNRLDEREVVLERFWGGIILLRLNSY